MSDRVRHLFEQIRRNVGVEVELEFAADPAHALSLLVCRSNQQGVVNDNSVDIPEESFYAAEYPAGAFPANSSTPRLRAAPHDSRADVGRYLTFVRLFLRQA